MLTDTYPDGKAILRDMWGKKAGVQDLDFRLGYRLSARAKLDLIASSLPQYRPFWVGKLWFYVLLGIIYLTMLYLVLLQVIPPQAEK